MTIDIAVRHRFAGFELDAAFRVAKPGVTALFGPSGAGKTTIVNAVAGLFRPQAGRIVIEDRVVFDSGAGIFVPPRARRIGYVFQEARLFPHMSVAGNLQFGWRRAVPQPGADAFAHVVDMLGLEHLLSRKPAKLSGGEKGRVALGRALLASPTLLLLDEPLAALDAARKAEIFPYLEKLRDEARLPMIYVTHSLEEVTRLADELVFVKEGRVAAQGSVFDLLPDLEFANLAGTPSYGAVFEAVVSAQRDDDRLTVLAFDGGELIVSRISRPPGTRLRVRLRAEDLMIARDRPRDISANNVLEAMIASTRADDDGHADVQLRSGGVKLVARITRASLLRLGLVPGMAVFVVVKSVIVDLR
ncbi:MAG: molybdenum ABC transporter ATP-binding protein [Rhizomicrobium sp.]|jgi:molybdate transport system ATP-binding protein